MLHTGGGADVLSTDVERVEPDPGSFISETVSPRRTPKLKQAGSDPPHLRRVVSPCHCCLLPPGVRSATASGPSAVR